MPTSASPRGRTGWSAPARRAFRGALEASPDLDSSRLTALYGVCDLLSEADSMQRIVDEEGRVVCGSQGQPVAHPLIAEVRHYRKQALDTIRTLDLGGRTAASAAGAALAGKRWRPPAASVSVGSNVTPISARRDSIRARLAADPAPAAAPTASDPAPF